MAEMTGSTSILGKILEPITGALSPEIAKRLLEARADAEAESRLAELRAKANEGELDDAEREEYESYVHAINLVSILRVKARQIVGES